MSIGVDVCYNTFMFENRIKQLQNALPNFEIDALLITSPYNISYLTGIHAFSIEEREARILVTKNTITLFTDARYSEMVKKSCPFVTLQLINSLAPFTKSLSGLIKQLGVKNLGFEEDNITYKEISDIEEQIRVDDLIPTSDIVEMLRETKDNTEIQEIAKACALSDKGFEFILQKIKLGVTELQIKSELENFMRSGGGKISFESIVAFGNNSALPHHMSNDTVLHQGDIILLDFGAKVNGYCSDMTRVVFMGQPSEQVKKMYAATKEAQEIAVDYLKTHMKEGFELKKSAELANGHLKAMGFSEIPHGLGHGVGLQVHENPILSPLTDDKLQPGMIVTVEPGIYIPGVGGIRIEDTLGITVDGIESLTKSSKDVIVIPN